MQYKHIYIYLFKNLLCIATVPEHLMKTSLFSVSSPFVVSDLSCCKLSFVNLDPSPSVELFFDQVSILTF